MSGSSFLRSGGYEHGDRFADGFLSRVTKSFSAPLFQLVIMPLRSLVIIASSERFYYGGEENEPHPGSGFGR